MPPNELCKAKHRRKVDGDQLIPEFCRIFRRWSSSNYSCIVHKYVDGAKLRDCFFDKTGGHLGVRQISGEIERLAASSKNFGARRTGIPISAVAAHVGAEI